MEEIDNHYSINDLADAHDALDTEQEMQDLSADQMSKGAKR